MENKLAKQIAAYKKSAKAFAQKQKKIAAIEKTKNTIAKKEKQIITLMAEIEEIKNLIKLEEQKKFIKIK